MKKAEPQVPFVPYRSDDRAPVRRHKRGGGEDMKKVEPQVPFVPYWQDDRTPHERVLELMDMTHAKTCRILKQLGRAWPRPADEPALNAHSSTYCCLRIPR